VIGQGKALFRFDGVEAYSLFGAHFLAVYPEVIIVQISDFCLDNFFFFINLPLTFDYFLHLSPQLESVMLGAIKYIKTFRVGDIISQHHQHLILL